VIVLDLSIHLRTPLNSRTQFKNKRIACWHTWTVSERVKLLYYHTLANIFCWYDKLVFLKKLTLLINSDEQKVRILLEKCTHFVWWD
jgi:hypothetical protein